LNDLVIKFKDKYPEVQAVDALQSEYDRRDFVLAFREIIKKRSEIQVYEDFDADNKEILMSEQEFMDFRSKYLDIAIGPIKPLPEPGPLLDPPAPGGSEDQEADDTPLQDIDFCLELLRSDVINVAYILELMADLDTNSVDYAQQRQAILDTMIKDAGMRNKTKLVDEFMRENIDNDKEGFAKAKADGTMDLESRLSAFVTRKRGLAVQELAVEEALEEKPLQDFLAEYDYLKREKLEIVQEAVRKKKAGLIERRTILDRVVRKLRNIMDIYNWD
jgi:type I restriction enzyme R subunit